ncbi:hypothetical protein [Duganella margarita]|uniref:hypothetical protein n=1 Tax=Duganella margarita TaxID=2692170 RepID=UPI0019281974|nr:hypothetical protein [Duganella margarita]
MKRLSLPLIFLLTCAAGANAVAGPALDLAQAHFAAIGAGDRSAPRTESCLNKRQAPTRFFWLAYRACGGTRAY